MTILNRAEAFLVIVDVQEKLMPVIDDHQNVERNLDRLTVITGVIFIFATVLLALRLD